MRRFSLIMSHIGPGVVALLHVYICTSLFASLSASHHHYVAARPSLLLLELFLLNECAVTSASVAPTMSGLLIDQRLSGVVLSLPAWDISFCTLIL